MLFVLFQSSFLDVTLRGLFLGLSLALSHDLSLDQGRPKSNLVLFGGMSRRVPSRLSIWVGLVVGLYLGISLFSLVFGWVGLCLV